jgi:hypothetical protein
MNIYLATWDYLFFYLLAYTFLLRVNSSIYKHEFSCWEIFLVRLYLQLFVGGLVSCIHYLCLLAYSGVQYRLCCVFVLSFFVLCTLCCQFLWIVHFWLPLSMFSNIYSHICLKLNQLKSSYLLSILNLLTKYITLLL